jgi:hypothetical protein
VDLPGLLRYHERRPNLGVDVIATLEQDLVTKLFQSLLRT